MSYFVFDMDETLAELYSVFYFVASLRIKELLDKDDAAEVGYPSVALQKQLASAYDFFVSAVLKEETSKRPLGILRPGILGVMENIHILQQLKKVKHVLIYSNNGHLQSLEFIRDLIHKHLGTTDLIGECIHWDHHMRQEEKTNKPGYASKTWNVLKNIIVNGHCGALPTLESNHVYFFDDLDHPDLQDTLKDNYYKVPAYRFKASFDRLMRIYSDALKMANVDETEFIKYVFHVFGKKGQLIPEDLDELLIMFLAATPVTSSENVFPPPKDEGIDMMMEALSKANMQAVAGKRRSQGTRKRKRSSNSKKHDKRKRTRHHK